MLAEILAARPNFLVLDEPTNHMDIPAKETLESAFRAYRGTLLFVSHDRYFIEQVADALLIFDGGEVLYYPFGYRHYLERRQRLLSLAGAYGGGSQTGASVNGTHGGRSLPGASVYGADGRESAIYGPYGGGNDLLAAGIRAEDQALIAGLQNVPRGANLLGRELSTEQAFLEWQLRLAAEAMEAAEKKAIDYMAAQETRRQQAYINWAVERDNADSYRADNDRADGHSAAAPETEVEDGAAAMSGMTAEVEDDVLAAWQAAILDWYDIWQELHPE